MNTLTIILAIVIFIGTLALVTNFILEKREIVSKVEEGVIDDTFKNIVSSFCTEHDCNIDEISVSHGPAGFHIICSTIAYKDIVMRIYFYRKKMVITYKNFSYNQFYDRKVFKKHHGIYYLQDIENTIHSWSLEMFGMKPFEDLTQHAVQAATMAIQNYKGEGIDLLLKMWDDTIEKAADTGNKQDLKSLMSLTSYLLYAHKDKFLEYISELLK